MEDIHTQILVSRIGLILLGAAAVALLVIYRRNIWFYRRLLGYEAWHGAEYRESGFFHRAGHRTWIRADEKGSSKYRSTYQYEYPWAERKKRRPGYRKRKIDYWNY